MKYGDKNSKHCVECGDVIFPKIENTNVVWIHSGTGSRMCSEQK